MKHISRKQFRQLLKKTDFIAINGELQPAPTIKRIPKSEQDIAIACAGYYSAALEVFLKAEFLEPNRFRLIDTYATEPVFWELFELKPVQIV